jgi:lipopolysaccharide/colanic/teichoic acid biosynthesis glycosyltransferase
MAAIALLIKLDSAGPIFFVQDRVGARRRRNRQREIVWEIQNFPFYKFRSMKHNADDTIHREHIKAFLEGDVHEEEDGEAYFKLQDDPRITRIGKFIRRTSLDELPQLFNVIKGDMSLVGPRPVPVYEVEGYLDWHHGRLAALPGITGMWQVNGRSRVTFEEMVSMDVNYIEQATLWADIKILLMTLPAVLAGDGAE